MSELCSTADAAVILGMDEDQVRALVRNGTLPAEAKAGGASLWRKSTLERWVRTGRHEGTLPPSPRLEVWGVKELARRFRVTDHAIKAWRLKGKLAEPTWTVAGMILWDADAVTEMTPRCDGCSLPVDIVDSETTSGRPTRLKCSCGEWVTMRPRLAA